ncbi:baculoviral IAP repeat-containing protein 3-like [Mytilus edulis]|uniref:baculoviral IAP repeat-containing protein 3-like n=1 Tax=Mytilus edulis TaxID=6550 RepID=UPI0039EF1DE1
MITNRCLKVLPSNHIRNRGSRKRNKHGVLMWDSSKQASSDVNPLISSGERLNTFTNWSISSCKWWPRMLSDAGFYYNHTDLECFQCRFRTNPTNWLPNETPKEAHARISPKCAFVKLYKQSARSDKPKSPEQISSCDRPINHKDNFNMKHSISEQNGNFTPEYVVVPHQNTNVMQTRALVKPLLSNDDNAFHRGGIHSDNSNIQSPSDIKTATSTVCDSANNPSYTEHSIQPTIDAMNSQLTIDGFQSRIQAPEEPEYRYPQYHTYSSRYQSYGNWPFPHKQTAHSLSEAGYFYTGENDIVRCFCCDLGLAEWDPKDNPWTEHARHNPRCIFLLTEKGKQFIDDIQKDWRKIYNPKHAAFDDKESRIATFDDWRRDIEQTPEINAHT